MQAALYGSLYAQNIHPSIMSRFSINILLTLVALLPVSLNMHAQKVTYLTKSCIYQGDTIPSVTLRTIYVYPRIRFNTSEEYIEYRRLVYNVKKVLPIATMINNLIIETYEYSETLPNERARRKHMKAVEKGLKEQFTSQMKKLTYSQGQLLIKLIARQSNQSSYEIIKAFMGSFKASTYQMFAKTFKSTLKVEYDPEGKDRMIERVVVLVQNRQL